ncbi:MAG: PilZ domain-containing protein [Candidatus Omnitrophica bacterium]|nr:PilZ domain-containing protein [Candidatus Omnitrophota bacterium]MCM8824393.1 PilZ domain-containing protein [Candidatus Omnitrophota bacterium]MCM8825972.1 PilZ domain-containing protein [Candidatus Omnitrophota bacterium]
MNNIKNQERRKSPRFTISLPVNYNFNILPKRGSVKIRARSKDISKDGISFVSSNQPPKSFIDIQIELLPSPKNKIVKRVSYSFIKAKVKILHSQPVSKEDIDIFSTGGCFVKMSKKDASLLRELLEQYQK